MQAQAAEYFGYSRDFCGLAAVLHKNLPFGTVRLQKKTPPRGWSFDKFLNESELRIESELKLTAFGG